MATNYKQGRFIPKNPKKYLGDPTNIIYRSGWEKRVMEYLDEQSGITAWSSEEVVIPYISPIDNRPHRYFVDFYVEATGTAGDKRKMLLEVKPLAQAQEPKKQSRKTKRYITEVMTWGVNQAKWKAAEEYCLDRGWEFKVITEKELFKKNSK
ncbi:head completion protein [bacterium]|nr:head completion protein [bacterium]